MKKEKSKFLIWFRRLFTLVLVVSTILLAALYLLPNQAPDTIELLFPFRSSEVENWRLGNWGFAAQTERWEVYFTTPSGEADRDYYLGGLDTALVRAISSAERTIDIAAYDFGQVTLTNALLAAFNRGVALRVVADDSNRGNFAALVSAGIPVHYDERSALMHNKFILIDGREVWTGSLNFTENGLYRNNNHMLRFRQPELVTAYGVEFEELYGGDFGRGSDTSNSARIRLGEVEYMVQFMPEYSPLAAIMEVVEEAEKSIRFLVFSFTLDELGELLIREQESGVDVRGIFDSRLAYGTGSEYPRLYCAGIPVFLDGNPFSLHHKVFIIDERWVLTGSLNYSQNGTERNDENWLLLKDRELAAEFLAEYSRVFERARRATFEECA